MANNFKKEEKRQLQERDNNKDKGGTRMGWRRRCRSDQPEEGGDRRKAKAEEVEDKDHQVYQQPMQEIQVDQVEEVELFLVLDYQILVQEILRQ